MPEHELARQKKQPKSDRTQHSSALDPDPLSQKLMTWDSSPDVIGETAISPPIQRHIGLLSDSPSAEVRAIIARQLQQTYGNQYVQRLVNSIELQAKLTMGAVDDPDEQEADQVAGHVANIPDPADNHIQSQRQTVGEENESQIQAIHQLPEIPQRQAGGKGQLQVSRTNRLIKLARLAADIQSEKDNRFARIWARGHIRFRLLTTADLETVFESGVIPESVLKDSIATALERMAKEGRLQTTDPVADVISRIFPYPGILNIGEYEAAVDVSDRTQIYENILEAQTKVVDADKPKLTAAMNDAVSRMGQSAADDEKLKLVFGSQKKKAKEIYNKAQAALSNVISNMDTAVSTDYNLDDPEVGLGGWADFSSQHIHLEPAVAKVKNESEAKITIIHEACHLADASVDDKGYYGSSAFEGMSGYEKVTNAAHFEEVPRRHLGTSSYEDDYEFKPGRSVSGAPLTFADKVKRKADEYLRKAWDKAVDVHTFLRETRIEILAGNDTTFKAKKKRIMKISQLMHLTIHQQNAASATITPVDIILAEGIAHGITEVQKEADKQVVPAPPVNSEAFYVRKVVEDSITAYNALTGNLADDLALTKWLVTNYRMPF